MEINQLKEEILEIRDKAIEELKEMHAKKMPHSSYAAGYEQGTAETCQQIIDLIDEAECE